VKILARPPSDPGFITEQPCTGTSSARRREPTSDRPSGGDGPLRRTTASSQGCPPRLSSVRVKARIRCLSQGKSSTPIVQPPRWRRFRQLASLADMASPAILADVDRVRREVRAPHRFSMPFTQGEFLHQRLPSVRSRQSCMTRYRARSHSALLRGRLCRLLPSNRCDLVAQEFRPCTRQPLVAWICCMISTVSV